MPFGRPARFWPLAQTATASSVRIKALILTAKPSLQQYEVEKKRGKKEPFTNTSRKEKEHSSYAGKAEAESIAFAETNQIPWRVQLALNGSKRRAEAKRRDVRGQSVSKNLQLTRVRLRKKTATSLGLVATCASDETYKPDTIHAPRPHSVHQNASSSQRSLEKPITYSPSAPSPPLSTPDSQTSSSNTNPLPFHIQRLSRLHRPPYSPASV